MPNSAEIVKYADRLPEVYRDILAAFPAIEPNRKAGYGIAFQTLAMHFANNRQGHSLGDVQAACKKLEQEGFVEIKNQIFVHPTELGEDLIAAVAEKPRASNLEVPELPARTW